jgi:hypothetical protein
MIPFTNLSYGCNSLGVLVYLCGPSAGSRLAAELGHYIIHWGEERPYLVMLEQPVHTHRSSLG